MAFKHHILAICAPSWGHQRPMVPILLMIVKERPDILITIPVIGQFKGKMDKEMTRYFTGENVLKDNIRVIQLSTFDGQELEYWGLMMQLCPVLLEQLLSCEPVTCSSGPVYPSVIKPNLCILDGTLSCPFGVGLLDSKKIQIISWCPPGLASAINIVGPREYGGFNVEERAGELVKARGITFKEATVEIFYRGTGEVRKVAGLPLAYDYQLIGEHSIPGGLEHWIAAQNESSRFMTSCDILLVNTPIIEKETFEIFGRWFSSIGRKYYALGPCVIPDLAVFDNEEATRGQEIMRFLDKALENHGKNSLLYMSFGTSVFPSGEAPWQLINIILDMKIPLVFTMPHGNTYETVLSNDLRNRLESSELAMVAKWTPQQSILNHEATGIILTHGGQGTLTESLVAGKPMIVWPLQADQPFNCMNLVWNLKVAYQLYEVRINHGLKPLYHGYQPTGTKEAIDREFRQVLKDAFGPDGDAKREIAQKLSKRLRETWKEGGEALSELRRFLRDNFSE